MGGSCLILLSLLGFHVLYRLCVDVWKKRQHLVHVEWAKELLIKKKR